MALKSTPQWVIIITSKPSLRELYCKQMYRTITYSLRVNAEDSDEYYTDISEFAREWTRSVLPKVDDLIQGFRAEHRAKKLPERVPESCAFDILVLGVLLREHGIESNQLSRAEKSLLGFLIRTQERLPKIEGLVKALRGFVYQLTVSMKRNLKNQFTVDTLLAWLRAAGEGAQADRLEEWVVFLKSRNIVEEATERLLRIAEDFSQNSQVALGKYTAGIDEFLENEAPLHKWRYDKTFIKRTRLEYHLGMLGNEILNATNRRAFLASEHRIVILPPCMRGQSDEKCKAYRTELGEHCANCTPTCRIHQITKLGEKYKFDVYIIPDELRIFSNKGEKKHIGIVGVSCVLTNWSGGWDVERLGIPAQGLLLDYVGCNYHWDKDGFPTDTNIRKLISILNKE